MVNECVLQVIGSRLAKKLIASKYDDEVHANQTFIFNFRKQSFLTIFDIDTLVRHILFKMYYIERTCVSYF